jgi:serine/threonine protein kinase
MPAPPRGHPSDTILSLFGAGKLDNTSAATVFAHLDICSDCNAKAVSLFGDDLLDRLRAALAGELGTPETVPESPNDPYATRLPEPGERAIPDLPRVLADNEQYDILRELGRGGMGVVYLANNKLMQRQEVLKVVNPLLLVQPGMAERFLREIRAAAQLRHSNIATAYAALQLGDLLVLAMEYVPGENLSQVVKERGPLPVVNACYYAQQVAVGLQHALERGMVHRDIKPCNLVLAREGKRHIVKILDFGLAKVRVADGGTNHDLTGTGQVLGTPDYMAPEQAVDAARADIRADIYSLGCTLYYLLTGRPPFQAKSVYALLRAHESEEATPVQELRKEVPAGVASVLTKTMAKDPAKRYQKPVEVAQSLAPFVKTVLKSLPTVPPKVGATSILASPAPAGSQMDVKKEGQNKAAKPVAIPVEAETRSHQTPKSAPKKPRSRFAVAWFFIPIVLFGAVVGGVCWYFSRPPTDNLPPELRTLRGGEEREVDLGRGVKMTFCWVPGGKAQLGSPKAERLEVMKNNHDKEELEWLKLEAEEARGKYSTKGFWLAKYPVTQEQWITVMGNNPSWFRADGDGKEAVKAFDTSRHPVENVCWDNPDHKEFSVQEFLRKMNASVEAPAAMGRGRFVLPHENEWEYACRGGKGNEQPYYFGIALKGDYSNCDGNYPFGTTATGDYKKRTTQVGEYENIAPHPWGLCDMSGNVYQWCENKYKEDGENRVVRGGSLDDHAIGCRAAYRIDYAPDIRYGNIGCRVCFRLD